MSKGNSGSGNGFKSLGLSDPVYRGIVRMGFRNPTPVQRKALPVIFSGVDAVVMARTGSGKTAAFLIPLLEKLLGQSKAQSHAAASLSSTIRGVVLSPTRELSTQTLRVFHKLAADTDIRAVGIHGGEGMEKQFDLLASKPDVLVATPGRLAHLLSEIPDLTLGSATLCIMDEADRLLEMGFASQIREISRSLPEHAQKVMLSATMPKVLVEFTKGGLFCTDPAVVRLDSEATVSDELRIAFITCRSADKDAALLHILQHIQEDQQEHQRDNLRTGLTLIFAATRHHVDYISVLLNASGRDNTTIYGSMDQEARHINLHAFKSGQKPILVVSDVAARGIDVPLIDHVIHYNFPAAPKLFVHRSGRAARAGRIGYCWGLVEPDEMPYMMELHLFLGRKPTPGETVDEKGEVKETLYTLQDMTPEMVHYGSVPESIVTREVENVNRILNSELTGSLDTQALKTLDKVCQNAIKQYRRTRPEASREAVRRAKEILEGKKLETGERVESRGSIPPHPLLRAAEKVEFESRQQKGGLETSDNLKRRQDFLRELSSFRPRESVFEAFQTGGGKKVGVVSHLDKGRTTGKQHDNSFALTAMKNMRRQMRIARGKGHSLFVAGSEHPQGSDDEEEEEEGNRAPPKQDEPAAAEEEEAVDEKPRFLPKSVAVEQTIESKRRLSKAERRRLKKNPDSSAPPPKLPDGTATKKKKQMRAEDFRDPNFFIDNEATDNSEEAMRLRQVEVSMQPSAANAARGSVGQARRMEEAMLDILGDENEELVKKQRLMRWDKSKRKYVRTTVGEELSGDSKSKKRRMENGQLVKNDKAKLGELYDKWQKKTNRSVGRTGVFDDVDDSAPARATGSKTKGGKNDEMKTAADIKKDRAKKQNLKIKNMKKSDRRSFERKQRNSKMSAKPSPGGKRGRR